MLLRALKEIPTVVNKIEEGQQFHELNPEQAQNWLEMGYAERVVARSELRQSRRGFTRLVWDNYAVAILASGQSLTEEVAAEVYRWRFKFSAADRRVIVVNTSFKRASWADILYACDKAWFDVVDPETNNKYGVSISQFFTPEKVWTQEQSAATEYGFNFIRSARLNGISRDPEFIHQGGNSGYQAINLAYLAGAKKILLFGFDMHGDHWHGPHPSPLFRKNFPFADWIKRMDYLARDIAQDGVEVINCTEGSALKCFPKVPSKEALK